MKTWEFFPFLGPVQEKDSENSVQAEFGENSKSFLSQGAMWAPFVAFLPPVTWARFRVILSVQARRRVFNKVKYPDVRVCLEFHPQHKSRSLLALTVGFIFSFHFSKYSYIECLCELDGRRWLYPDTMKRRILQSAAIALKSNQLYMYKLYIFIIIFNNKYTIV